MTTEAPPGKGAGAAVERLGPYRLVHRIGEGGMGLVYLAVDQTGRAVAIKVLRPHVSYDTEARARLEREVETLSRIRHPRVAPVLDADLHGDRPYLVTRFVAGPPLDEVVSERGPLHGDALVRLARGLAGALDAIHAVGVVHRDLKPGNVLIEDDDEPVLIDFGIAHLADDIRLTSTGLVMGTPGYLAPEVIDGEPVTESTDWWGWAATLAFAATGRPPFGRGPMDAVLARVRAGEFDVRGIDVRLEPLLAAALNPDPGRRPPAAEVMAGLERYAAGRSATTESVLLPPDARTGDGVWSGPRHTDVLPVSPPAFPAPGSTAPGAAAPGHAAPGYAAPGHAAVDLPQGPWGPQPFPGARHDGVDDLGWLEEERPHDPRIGLPGRAGLLAALLGLLVALAALGPVVALGAFAGWGLLARTVDRCLTWLVLRRYERGARRGDVALGVVLGPWQFLLAAFATVGSMLLPILVGVSALLCSALLLKAAGVHGLSQLSAPTLAVGALAGALVGWWGPGGVSLRRGSRSLCRGMTRTPLAQHIVVGVVLVATLAVGGWVTARAGVPVWWPLAEAPGLLSALSGD